MMLLDLIVLFVYSKEKNKHLLKKEMSTIWDKVMAVTISTIDNIFQMEDKR